jgi:hypothetical protein
MRPRLDRVEFDHALPLFPSQIIEYISGDALTLRGHDDGLRGAPLLSTRVAQKEGNQEGSRVREKRANTGFSISCRRSRPGQ